MRSIELPELKFSDWYKWDNRNQYVLKGYPGVYLISITDNPRLEGSSPEWKDVVYIGMTNSMGGLTSRWSQFLNGIRGKPGHSGGKTIFENMGNYDNWKEHLFVAAMGVECDVKNPMKDDYLKMGWVAYFEYEAFAYYYENVGGHPRYNKH